MRCNIARQRALPAATGRQHAIHAREARMEDKPSRNRQRLHHKPTLPNASSQIGSGNGTQCCIRKCGHARISVAMQSAPHICIRRRAYPRATEHARTAPSGTHQPRLHGATAAWDHKRYSRSPVLDPQERGPLCVHQRVHGAHGP
jgi:hypothetical protein